MLDLVKAYILNFGQKISLNLTTLNLAGLTLKSIQFANILLKYLAYKLYIASS